MTTIEEIVEEEKISEMEQTLRKASEFIFNTGLYAANSITLTNISTPENPLPIMTDWGDGTINSNLTHSYDARGTYTVRTYATIGENTNSMVCLKKVNRLASMEYDINILKAIINCENLEYADFSNIVVKYDSDSIDGLFMNCKSLHTVNLANWNTNGIVDMSNMFNGCSSLEKVNFDMWDTTSVIDMSYMFSDCASLRELQLNFETTNVTNMSYMFNGCSSLEKLELSNWDLKNKIRYIWNTINVTNMSYMFNGCTSLNYLNISTWDTSSVDNCYNMLYGVPKISAKNWNYDGVNYNRFLLTEYQTGYIDTFPWSFTVIYTIKEFKLTHIEKEKYLPRIYEDYNPYPEEHDIFLILKDGNITNDLSTPSVLVDKIKVRALQTIEKIKFSNTYITNIESIVTKNLVDMSYMFSDCIYLTELDLSYWDTRNVNTMERMFSGCSNLISLDLANWNTVKVENMEYMFNGCTSLQYLNITSFDIENTSVGMMFLNIPEITAYGWLYDGYESCNKISSLNETITGYDFIFPWHKYMVEYSIRPRHIADKLTYQYDKTKSSYLPIVYSIKNNDTDILLVLNDGSITNDTDILVRDIAVIKVFYSKYTYSVTFEGYDDKHPSFISELRRFDTIPFKTANKMFRNCIYLEYLDLSSWDTRNITNMSHMFSGCIALKLLDLGNWDTRNVTDMSHMFSKCSSLELLDLSGFITTKVQDISNMFNYCNSLKNIITTRYDEFGRNKISDWDTSNITNMQYLFADCSSLESLDIADWDTCNVDNMQYMFWECEKITSLDLSKWDVSKVTDMDGMFRGCESLESLNISTWNTSRVYTMVGLFANCNLLKDIDISNFNTKSLINASELFKNCTSLVSLDLSNWNVSNVTYMRDMFNNCTLLEDLNISTWDTTNVKHAEYMFDNINKLSWIYTGDYNKLTLDELHTNYCNIFPWSDMGYIEYKVVQKDKYSESLTAGSNHSDHRYYLPRIYTSLDSYFYPEDVIITLNDGSTTNDLETPISNIEKIRINFNRAAVRAIKFYSSDKDYCCVTDILGFSGKLIDLSHMFHNCIYLKSVTLTDCDITDALDISHIFYNCKNIDKLDINWDKEKITSIDYSCTFPYNTIIYKD